MDSMVPWTSQPEAWLAMGIAALPLLWFQNLRWKSALFPITALVVYAITLGYFLFMREGLIDPTTALEANRLSFLLYRFENGLDFRLSLTPSFEGAVFGLLVCGWLQIPLILHIFKPKRWNALPPEILVPFVLTLLISMLRDALGLALAWSLIISWLFVGFSRWNTKTPLVFVSYIGGLCGFSLVFSVVLLGGMGGSLELSRLFSQDACLHFIKLDSLGAPALYSATTTLGGLSWFVAMGLGTILPWLLRHREKLSISFVASWVFFILSSTFLAFQASPCFGIEGHWPISLDTLGGFVALSGLVLALAWIQLNRFSLNFSCTSQFVPRLLPIVEKGRRVLLHPLGFLLLVALGLAVLLLFSLHLGSSETP